MCKKISITLIVSFSIFICSMIIYSREIADKTVEFGPFIFRNDEDVRKYADKLRQKDAKRKEEARKQYLANYEKMLIFGNSDRYEEITIYEKAIVRNAHYYKDSSTDICFAISTIAGGGCYITAVPCTPKVEREINFSKNVIY